MRTITITNHRTSEFFLHFISVSFRYVFVLHDSRVGMIVFIFYFFFFF